MIKFLLLSLSLFTFLSVSTGQASSAGQTSDLGEKPPTTKKVVTNLPSFDHTLVPAELPFHKRCDDEKIKIDWKIARASFFRIVKYGYNDFTIEVGNHLHIDDNQLEILGLQKLYEQYNDFYNRWKQVPSEKREAQKENQKPRANTVNSSSSSSSSAAATINTVEDENDADTLHSATTPLLNALRQRHLPASNSTVTVK